MGTPELSCAFLVSEAGLLMPTSLALLLLRAMIACLHATCLRSNMR